MSISKITLTDPDAQCLDGSPYQFYIRYNSENQFLIFHEGGGWCTHVKCHDTPQVKSNTLWPESSLDWIFLTSNSNDNPNLQGQTLVYLHSCDGGSFSGQQPNPLVVDGVSWYQKGKQILQAAVNYLNEHYNLQNATDVVISGGSAGGLAVLMNIDWQKSVLNPTTFVTGLCNAGFFLKQNSNGVRQYQSLIEGVQAVQNVQTNLNCLKVASKPSDCMFAETLLPNLGTPVFFMNSKQDEQQLQYIYVPITNSDQDYQGNLFVETITTAMSLTKINHFVVVDACLHHGSLWQNGNVQQNDQIQSIAELQDQWVELQTKNLIVDQRLYPCKECCQVLPRCSYKIQSENCACSLTTCTKDQFCNYSNKTCYSIIWILIPLILIIVAFLIVFQFQFRRRYRDQVKQNKQIMEEQKINIDEKTTYWKNFMLNTTQDSEGAKNLQNEWANDQDVVFKDWSQICPQRGAEQLHRQLEQFTQPTGTILDFGCGTGQVGENLHRLGQNDIVGIDIADQMLATSDKKGIYKSLILQNMEENFDLDGLKAVGIICTGVFSQINNQDVLFRNWVRLSQQGAIWVFTQKDMHHVNNKNGFNDVLSNLVAEGHIEVLEVSQRNMQLPKCYDDLVNYYIQRKVSV